MSNAKIPTSTYAGRSMTIDELADAREAVEKWASMTYERTNPKMLRDISHLCTLAQGMWFQNKDAR